LGNASRQNWPCPGPLLRGRHARRRAPRRDQPNGWFGGTVEPDIPILVNLRLDPFERTGMTGSVEYFQWFKFEFWRFVYVQQEVAKFAQTAIEFPPMQKGASFNLEAVKDQIQKAAQIHAGK
jgi:hypothetical protein